MQRMDWTCLLCKEGRTSRFDYCAKVLLRKTDITCQCECHKMVADEQAEFERKLERENRVQNRMIKYLEEFDVCPSSFSQVQIKIDRSMEDDKFRYERDQDYNHTVSMSMRTRMQLQKDLYKEESERGLF